MSQINMFDTLSSAKHDFNEQIEVMKGADKKMKVECPCCNHVYSVWHKSITVRVAITLHDMYSEANTDWIHVPSTKRTMCQNYQDAKFWGLIEEGTKEVMRGGKNSGFWRITEKGAAFINGEISIPKYSHVYLSQCVGYSGKQITFDSCFGEKFDFQELIRR